jgi:hypothetical protein
MKIENAKLKLIQCHEADKTYCIIWLIIQFGTELLQFYREYLKSKNDEKLSEKHRKNI